MAKKEIKSNFETGEILSLDEIQKIKIIKIYDWVKDNKTKIEESGFSLTPIAKSFNLSRIEIVSYLKNVCELSQKLELKEVCMTLNSVKEKLEEESAKKKPTNTEIQFKETLKDERFALIDLGASTINSKEEPIEDEEELFPQNKNNSLYSSLADDDYEVISEDEAFNKKPENAHFEKEEDEEELFPQRTKTEEVNDIDIVDDDHAFQQQISKELIENDVEFIEDAPVLVRKENKNKSKFIFIGGALALVIISLTTATMMFSSLDSHENTGNTITLNEEILNKSPIVENNSPIAEIKRDEVIVKDPIVLKEEREIIAPPVENHNADSNIMTPPINSYSNVSPNDTDERLNKMEDTLNQILRSLDARGSKTEKVEKPTKSDIKQTIIASNQESSVETTNEQVISFEDLDSVAKVAREFKVKDDYFEYKGQLFKKGDVLGNVRVELIVPTAFIKFRDLTLGSSKSVRIK